MADFKVYAQEHGYGRGWRSKEDALPTGDQPSLNTEREDEGLLTFVQSTICRRRVWAEAFDRTKALGMSSA